MSNKKIALAGYGYWGKNIARNLFELGVLHTICDTLPENRKKAKNAHPVAVTGDWAAVLADSAIEAVALATPAETHYTLGMEALMAGKDIFVEKPLALQVDHAREMVKTAEERGAILMVGHVLQYHPAVEKMRQMVADGEIGQLQAVYSNRMSLGKIRREENVLWSFAPHDVSLIRSLVGEEPERIYSSGGCFLGKEIADTTLSLFEYSSGVRAHIYVSWLHPFKEQRLVVVGSEKMLVFDDVEPEDKLLLYPHEISWSGDMPVPTKKEAMSIPIEKGEPLRREFKAFIDAIETRRPPITDGREGLETLKILTRCQESLETGAIITAPPAVKKGESYFIHPSATVDQPVEIGAGSKIWHNTHISKNARLGQECNLGQNVFVGEGVIIGDRVKIQNNVSVYTGVELGDEAFCGPSMVFTNVNTPRSGVDRKGEYKKTVVGRGVSFGANSVIVCGGGITIGEYAFIGAGAVVTSEVFPYALVVGSPARQAGWRCRCGLKIEPAKGKAVCGKCGDRYIHDESSNKLRPEPARGR